MTNNSKITTLIFVYSAKGGLFNGIADYIHKNISPNTYPCSLCAVTYNNLGMKKAWKDYLKSLSIEKDFLHKEDLPIKYPEFKDEPLPIVLAKTEDSVNVLLTSQQLNKFETQEDLIAQIEGKLKSQI